MFLKQQNIFWKKISDNIIKIVCFDIKLYLCKNFPMNTNQVKTINDPALGEIVFSQNQRAKRCIIRISSREQGKVSVTVPASGSVRDAEKFFYKERENIIKKLAALKAKYEKTAENKLSYNKKELKTDALNFLPSETARLAAEHNFHYQKVTVRETKTRWGSCSARKNISLSVFLMTLPRHLIHYVILHELCHTVEMNHSAAFWALLDRCTGGKAKALRREIRKFGTC
jgi:predicted metal-dependent hydrolase